MLFSYCKLQKSIDETFHYHGYSQSYLRTAIPDLPTADSSSKTTIVTASNVSLGKEAIRYFDCLNAENVIGGVRSIAKCEASREEIETAKIETIQHGILSEMGLQVYSLRLL